MHRVIGMLAAAALSGAAVLASASSATSAAGGPQLEQVPLPSPDPQPDVGYGQSVASDGTVVVVGSPAQPVNGVDSGEAFVFVRPASGWKHVGAPVVLQATVAGEYAYFGSTVAIAGRTIAVAAGNANGDEGVVYVFTEPKHGWRSTSRPTATLTASDATYKNFLGSDLAIDGRTIVAGAPGHQFGSNFSQGATYVYVEPKHGWHGAVTQTAELTGTSTVAGDDFGASVAMSGDTIAVGAPNREVGSFASAGVVYVFDKPRAGWPALMSTSRELEATSPSANDYFGDYNELAMQGPTLVVGADQDLDTGSTGGPGAAYVFTRPSGGWQHGGPAPLMAHVTLSASDGADSDSFGAGIALSGSIIAVASPTHQVGSNAHQGVLYTFSRPTHGWHTTSQTSELTLASGEAGDELGLGALSIDGSAVFAGAESRDSGMGAAFGFTPPAPALTKITQSHRTWRLGGHNAEANPTHKPKGGTEFRFTANHATTVSLRFSERGSHGRSVAKGSLTVQARSGRNRVFFDGRIGHGHRLRAGHCAVTIQATDSSGESRVTTLHFTTRA